MFDACLIKLADSDWVFHLRISHLISDGYSFRLVYSHLAACYGYFLAGNFNYSAIFTPFEAVVKTDRGREALNPCEVDKHDRPLDQLPRINSLQFYRSRSKETSLVSYRLEHTLDSKRYGKLVDQAKNIPVACRSINASLFSCLACILVVYLHRISGESSILLGVNYHNRQILPNAVGLLMRVLPIQVDIDGNDTFISLIEKINCEVDHGKRSRDGAMASTPRSGGCEVLLNYITGSFADFCGVDVEPIRHYQPHHNYGLALTFFRKGPADEVNFDLYLRNDLFSEEDGPHLLEQLIRIMDAFLANPSDSVGMIRWVPDREEGEIKAFFKRVACQPRVDGGVHRFFEGACDEIGDALAIESEGAVLRYKCLKRRVNQLSNYPYRLGLRPKQHVGISLPRSVEMVVAVLAVMRAGGTIVPLALSSHEAQGDSAVGEMRVEILLTQADRGAAIDAERIVFLDGDAAEIERESIHSPVVPVLEDQPACKYSVVDLRGNSKRVTLQQRPLLDLVQWQVNEPDFAHSLRTLQLASICLPMYLQEIFCALRSGGTLVLVKSEIRRDMNLLARFICEHRIERLFIPVVSFQRLADALCELPYRDLQLKEVITSGEQMGVTHATQQLCKLLPELRVHHQYCWSEFGIVASSTLSASVTGDHSFRSIGRPIANAQIHILDGQLQPLPFGVTGEICVGGGTPPMGCLDPEGRPPVKLISIPCGDGPVFRSGRLGRYLRDGTVEFVGAIDDRVTIGGSRVLLREVESMLRRCEPIAEAAVVRQEGEDGKRLVAFICPRSNQQLSLSEVRAFLTQRLPRTAVPTRFIALDCLPLAPSGSIDYGALFTRTGTCTESDGIADRPSSLLATRLIEIWENILDVRPISCQDSFFDLGGNSVQSVRLFERIEKCLGLVLPVVTIFEAQTIEKLAESIHQGDHFHRAPGLLAFHPDGPRPPFFWFHGLDSFPTFTGISALISLFTASATSGLTNLCLLTSRLSHLPLIIWLKSATYSQRVPTIWEAIHLVVWWLLRSRASFIGWVKRRPICFCWMPHSLEL